MKVYEKLYTLIENLTGYPQQEIKPQLELVKIIGMDPLAKMEVIFAIEIEFNIDISAKNVYRIKKVVDLIDEIN